MTQDDTTALTWFHQWSLLVVFYCSDSAWSSPFLVQFRMSQRQFHSLRRARGCLHSNGLIHSNHSVSFYYMIWQYLPVHVQAVQPPSSPWSDLQDLQCLHRIQLGPGTCNSDSTASSAVQKLSCSCGVWKHCALSTFITLTRGFTSSTSKPITPWVPWCHYVPLFTCVTWKVWIYVSLLLPPLWFLHPSLCTVCFTSQSSRKQRRYGRKEDTRKPIPCDPGPLVLFLPCSCSTPSC